MRPFLHLAFAAALFAAVIASESYSSDLLRITEDGWYAWHVEGDERFVIHARIESGRPREFFIPDLQCSRRDAPASEDLGTLGAAESIAWLRRFISPRSEISAEVLAAISVHPGADALAVLEAVVRTDSDRQNRREAVFWLAQSDDDEAYQFLDALLAGDPTR